jgi:hypothetical protein
MQQVKWSIENMVSLSDFHSCFFYPYCLVVGLWFDEYLERAETSNS